MVRIRKILCPVDFSPSSIAAVTYAVMLAKNCRASITLLHVVTPPMAPAMVAGYELPVNYDELIRELTHYGREELDKLSKRVQAAGVTSEVIVRYGDVDLILRSIVRGRNIDLIAMGRHGRRGVEKLLIGSVADRILRRAPVPLLMIGGPEDGTGSSAVKRILVTTDLSKETANALSYALFIAGACEATSVTLLHVLNDVDADISGRYREPLIRSIHHELQALIPKDLPKGFEVTTRVEAGLPNRRIVPIVKTEKIDLIVMNVRGKTLIDRVMIGSTAERLVRAVSTPLLIIPPMAARNSRRSKRVAKK